MAIRASAVVRTSWAYLRVPVYLVLSVIAAFFAACIASQFADWGYERIIAAYHWVVGNHTAENEAPPTRGQLFAGLAVGAAVLLTWFREVIQKVDALWPWNTATAASTRAAMVAMFASALGLFISAFAVEKSSKPTTDFTLAFDGVTLPAVTAFPQKGLASFYIPFYAEASYGALSSDDDPAVRVPEEFASFLNDLSNVLSKCGVTNAAPITLNIKGFASVTKWHAIQSDTDPEKMSEITQILAVHFKSQHHKSATEEQLVELKQHFLQSRNEVAELEKREAGGSDTPWADAFNLWLANKRRDAVVQALSKHASPESTINVSIQPWENYSAMTTALAVDDGASIRRGTSGGLLSRSVVVTIASAGRCEREISKSGAVLTAERTDNR